MRTLFVTASICATIAIVAEVMLSNEAMVVLLSAISLVVVQIASYLIRRERTIAARDFASVFACRARQDRAKMSQKTPDHP